MSEFDLIARLSRRLAGQTPQSAGVPGTVGIGDDCAAIPHGQGVQLLTCDIAVAGRHFLPGRTPWADVGWKVATASVSDVLACGGVPRHALVSLGVPAGQDAAHLETLYDGLAQASEAYGFAVLGGNVSGASELIVDLFMVGEAPRFIARSGARPGDKIVVAGPLGDAAAGLSLFGEGRWAPHEESLVQRHLRPQARPDLVPLLQAAATAAIDISDGLAAELNHLATQSGVAIAIEGAAVPLSDALQAYAESRKLNALALATQSGEEYALLFTVPPDRLDACSEQGLSVIGTVSGGSGVTLDGEPLPPKGWDHLAGP